MQACPQSNPSFCSPLAKTVCCSTNSHVRMSGKIHAHALQVIPKCGIQGPTVQSVFLYATAELWQGWPCQHILMGQTRCKRCLAGDGRAWLCVWVCQQLAEREGRLQSIIPSANRQAILQDQLAAIRQHEITLSKHDIGWVSTALYMNAQASRLQERNPFEHLVLGSYAFQAWLLCKLGKAAAQPLKWVARTCMASSRVKSAIAGASWHGPGCSMPGADELVGPVGHMTCVIECMMPNAIAYITRTMCTNTACPPCTLMCRW